MWITQSIIPLLRAMFRFYMYYKIIATLISSYIKIKKYLFFNYSELAFSKQTKTAFFITSYALLHFYILIDM